MSDEAEEIEGEEGEEQPKKKSMLKLGLFIGLPALIVVLGAVAAVLFLMGGGEEEQVAEGEHAEDGEYAEHADDGEGYGGGYDEHSGEVLYYPLDDEHETAILVNIQADGGRSPVLKLELMLEFTDPDVQAALDEHIARVYDQYLIFLRELRVEDLSGSAGTYRLKMELVRRVNLAIAPLQVDDVLIQSMLIQ